MAETYKLTYFNVKGRGEPIRLLFAYAEVPYEDNRIEKEQWAEIKPTMPFGQIPVLHVGNKTLSQSKAICRYLANKYNMGGEDYWEAAKMDEISDTLNDVQAEWGKFFFEQDPAKKAELQKEFVAKTLSPCFEKLEAVIKENGGFLVGKRISWIDIVFAHLLEVFVGQNPGSLERYPNILKLKETIYSVPQIKAYVNKRPVTAF